MARDQAEQHHDPVIAAIEQVLGAERSAEARLQDARRQAETLIAAARERAAAINRRTDARISKLHAAYFNKVSADVANLSTLPTSIGAGTDVANDSAALAEAAQRLAAKLTGDT